MTTYTPDHAVAICVNNRVDAVVLDQQHFIQTEGWSVANSLKMIRATICVVLIVRGKVLTPGLPDGVDAVLADRDQDGLLRFLEKLPVRKNTKK